MAQKQPNPPPTGKRPAPPPKPPPKPPQIRVACILEQANYKPGDQAPEGYLAWHEWADVQHKAGLRQKQCGRCGLWRYPQQLSAEVDRADLVMTKKRKSRRVTVETPVCNDCSKTPNVGVQRRPAHDGRDPQDGLGPSAATTGSASVAEGKGR